MINREVGGLRDLPDGLELVLSGTPAPGGYEALASCFDYGLCKWAGSRRVWQVYSLALCTGIGGDPPLDVIHTTQGIDEAYTWSVVNNAQ